MSRSVNVRESVVFPVPVGDAWELVTRCDLTYVSQRWGPIPGIVAIRDEPPRFFDEPGHSRILVNSDASTVVETIRALDPPRSIDYTISELTNAFRHLTSGATARFDFEPVDNNDTRVTWHYAWDAHNAASLPLVWLITHVAYRPYMRGMLERMSKGTVS
ncbi:MAG: SRPBCC family protein [Acidimicrobiia bacterium]